MAIQIPIDNVRLPSDVEEQMVAPIAGAWNTVRIPLDGGGMQAAQLWADPLRRYDVRCGASDADTLAAVRDVIVTRRGIRGFLLLDISDYLVTDGVLGTGDGAETDFPLVKVYADATVPYSRRIRWPLAATIVAKVDGVETSHTLQSGDIVRIAPAPALGLVVTATFQFLVPVALVEDEQMLNVLHSNLHDLDSFGLQEVKEYAA